MNKVIPREPLLKIWKANKKIANIQAERDELVDELTKKYGNRILDDAYANFELGVY